MNKGTLYLNKDNGRYYLDTGAYWMRTWFDGSWVLGWHSHEWTKSRAFKRIGNNYNAKD